MGRREEEATKVKHGAEREAPGMAVSPMRAGGRVLPDPPGNILD